MQTSCSIFRFQFLAKKKFHQLLHATLNRQHWARQLVEGHSSPMSKKSYSIALATDILTTKISVLNLQRKKKKESSCSVTDLGPSSSPAQIPTNKDLWLECTGLFRFRSEHIHCSVTFLKYFLLFYYYFKHKWLPPYRKFSLLLLRTKIELCSD